MRRIENCYLCGATDDLTNDHVPPKSFFPTPRPKNLITVRCCRNCNQQFGLDDEAMLIWLSSVDSINDKGKWILNNTVRPKLKKKEKLRKRVAEHIRIETINLPNGPARFPLSYFPDERGDRFMIRLTKGFIRHFHPEYDYSHDKFEVQPAKPFNPSQWEHWGNIIRIMESSHNSRGDGVIDFWHSLPDEGWEGVWIYCFYGAVFFAVYQTKIGTAPLDQI